MEISKMIPVAIATDILKISSSSIATSKKYKPFYVKASKGNKNAKFDLEGYLKNERMMSELTEKTKLLTEYLHHIENISYGKMGKITKVSANPLKCASYGFNKALLISKAVRIKLPNEWKRFHEYYGWKTS